MSNDEPRTKLLHALVNESDLLSRRLHRLTVYQRVLSRELTQLRMGVDPSVISDRLERCRYLLQEETLAAS